MINKVESQLHKNLVAELAGWLANSKGYTIEAVDLEGYPQPNLVGNGSHLGDGGDKRPDIYAFDGVEEVHVRGEAKTGDGDLESPHTETQFRLFTDLYNPGNDKMSMLYTIVPPTEVAALNQRLRELELFDKPHVVSVKSGKF